jgi:hypothetical protein
VSLRGSVDGTGNARDTHHCRTRQFELQGAAAVPEPTMNEPAAVSDRSCLDCGAHLRPEQNFCHHCAQRADVQRLTIHTIVHDFLHALFHADRSVFSLLKALFIRPGHVAREYVAGRRRSHFGPFATLLVLIAIAVLLFDVTGFQSFTRSDGLQLNALLNFLELHLNLIVFVQVPLLSLLCLAVFRMDGFNYAEHTVLAAYAFCLRAVIFCLFILPFWYVVRPAPSLVGYLSTGIWCPYVGVATSQFYSGNKLLSWLKGTAAASLTLVMTSYLIDGLSMLYGTYARN